MTPLDDWILIKRLEEESISKGGIIIPEISKKKLHVGTVCDVGEGTYAGCPHCECPHCDRDLIKSDLSVGDKVFFQRNSTVDTDEEGYLLIRERDILGIGKHEL